MTYEYECSVCGHECIIEQSIKDNPVKKCPSCYKPKLERVISTGGFVLSGNGWARDGYSKNLKNST